MEKKEFHLALSIERATVSDETGDFCYIYRDYKILTFCP